MERIFGADRLVLYLEDAVDALDSLDGSREQRITSAVEKFLDSPESTFDKTVDSHVWQVRDLNTNTRALATWCQNTTVDAELCVVHLIYQKTNERHAFAHRSEFDTEGEAFQERFSGLDSQDYSSWKSQMEHRNGVRLRLDN